MLNIEASDSYFGHGEWRPSKGPVDSARYWSVTAAVVVLLDYSPAKAPIAAGIVIVRTTRHRNATKTAASASPRQSSASGSIFASRCPPSPNGHAVGLTNVFATKSKPSKLRRDGLRSLSIHSSSRITSADRFVFSTLGGTDLAISR
jgi:hypothetical protein